MMHRFYYRSKFFQAIIIVLFFAVVSIIFPLAQAHAAQVPPEIISYQGRLTNSDGNLLGGNGTTYYFKFSIWNSPTVGSGSQLWPVTSHATSATVKQGVFTVNIGDTANGYPDALNLDFSKYNNLYLQVQVSSNNTTFETLSPRQRLTSALFAQVSGAVVGTSTPSVFGTTTPITNSFVTIAATSSNSVPLSISGSLNQTANLFQIFNSIKTNLFSINAKGGVAMVNATSTNFFATTASSINLSTSNLSVGSLSGFLKATAGIVTTALVNLSSDVTGILPITSGGIGTSTAPSYGQLLIGNASGAYDLVATSTLGINSSNGTVTSIGASGGTTGLSFSGSPIISAGTFILNGILNVANGGTGASTLPYGLLSGNGTGALTHIATSSLGILTTNIAEGTNLYYTNARVSANSSVVANTVKVGITPTQASDITTNNAKVGITSGQSSAIVANTVKVGITSTQTSDITSNNAKVGITTSQASAITANNAKVGITTTQAGNITTNNAKVTESTSVTAPLVLTGTGISLPSSSATVNGYMPATDFSRLLNTSGTNTGDQTNITGNAGTVTNGLYSTSSYANPAWLTAVPYSILSGTVPTWNQNTTGNAGTATALQTSRSIAGVLFNGTSNISLNNNAITNGAGYTTNTGTVTSVATDATLTGSAITTTGTFGLNLANANTWTGAQSFGTALIPSLATPAGAFLAVNSSGQVIATTTPSGGGSGSTYTATYPITLTGSAFGLAFGTTTSNKWAGTQTFTNLIAGSISGNAGTVTNGLYSTSSYANPAWLTAVPYSILSGTVPTWNQNTTGTATSLSGGLGGQIPYQSGVGITAMLSNGAAGQVLQSNGTTLAPSWVTPASGGGSNFVPYTGATADVNLGAHSLIVNTNQLFVNNTTGNVGIGTAVPTQKLDVAGNGLFAGNLNVGGDGVFTGTIKSSNFDNHQYSIPVPAAIGDATEFATVTNTDFSSNVEIWFSVHSPYFAQSKRYILPVQYNGTNGGWQKALPISTTGIFYGNDAEIDVKVLGQVATFRIRRKSGTWPGIASITLAIGGDILGTTVSPASGTYTNQPFESNYPPTSLTMYNGNTGINTDTPTAKLDVNGNFRLRDTTQGAGKVLTSDANGFASWKSKWFLSGNNIYYNVGNVGIGTSNPTAPLEITGGTALTGTHIVAILGNTSAGFNIANDANASYLIEQRGTSYAVNKQAVVSYPGVRFGFQKEGTWNMDQGGAVDGSFVVQTSSGGSTLSLPVISEKFRITSSGNVGIGTPTPVSKLTVIGSGCFSVGTGATSVCGTTPGNIYYTTANTGNYDIAEKYRTYDMSLSAGDVITLDSAHALSVTMATSSDVSFIGVVSTAPGVLLGGASATGKNAKFVPVALSGRVPVKFSLAGGAVAVGDRLTVSSTTPGVAVKLIGYGAYFGQALQAYTHASTTASSTIVAFINPGIVPMISLTGTSIVSSASSPQSFTSSLFRNIFSHIAVWFANSKNGITDFFANRVHTKELCLSDSSGETCITRIKLDALLANVSSTNTSTSTATTTIMGSPINTATGSSTSATNLASTTATSTNTTSYVATSSPTIATTTTSSNTPSSNASSTPSTTTSTNATTTTIVATTTSQINTSKSTPVITVASTTNATTTIATKYATTTVPVTATTTSTTTKL